MAGVLQFSICSERSEAGAVADFFAMHAAPEYISHSEMYLGRADLSGQWSPELPHIILMEIMERQENDLLVIVVRQQNEIVACAFLSFQQNPCLATLEDLVVATQARQSGIGSEVLSAVERIAADRGATAIFLESGTNNDSAHSFFGKHGYAECSRTMMKRL